LCCSHKMLLRILETFQTLGLNLTDKSNELKYSKLKRNFFGRKDVVGNARSCGTVKLLKIHQEGDTRHSCFFRWSTRICSSWTWTWTLSGVRNCSVCPIPLQIAALTTPTSLVHFITTIFTLPIECLRQRHFCCLRHVPVHLIAFILYCIMGETNALPIIKYMILP